MSSPRQYSLAQIFADHRALKLREEFSTEWAVAVLYRPMALVLTWALQHTPVTPTMITATGLCLFPAMVAAAALLPPGAALGVVVILACAFMILDCADGPLARLRNEASMAGQYADFAADIFYRFVFYGTAGWILAQHPGLSPAWLAGGGLALALGSAWMMTFARLCRVYAELRFPEPGPPPPPPPSVASAVEGFVSGLDGLIPLIAAGAWVLDIPGAFYGWIFAYGAADLVNTQAGIIRRLRSGRS